METETITQIVLAVLGGLATILFPAVAKLVFQGVPALLEAMRAKTHSEFLKQFLAKVDVLVVAAEQEYKVKYAQAVADGKLSKDEIKMINRAMFDAVKSKSIEIINDWPSWVRSAIEPIVDHAIESAVHRISTGKKP